MQILYIILFPIFSFFQSYDWVSFEMVQRSNQKGKTTEVRSLVYFDKESQMTIRQLFPMDLFISNNSDGELVMYNPETNEVYQMMNFMMSSQQNQYYFFLQGKTDNMGLIELGFELEGSRLVDQLLISTFSAPPDVKQYFDKIEMVHEGRKPIFIGYIDKKGKYLKKVFYYDYMEDLSFMFPGSITEINYVEKNDSIIAKTSFKEFRVNDLAHKDMVAFDIPEDAKLIE